MPSIRGWSLIIKVDLQFLFLSISLISRQESQQFEVPSYRVDLRSILWPNGKASSSRLAMKFSSTAVCDQMNLKPKFDGLVVNGHQVLFAIAANAHLRKRSHNPGLLVGRKVINADRRSALQSTREKRHRSMRTLGDLLSSPHLQVVSYYDNLLCVWGL